MQTFIKSSKPKVLVKTKAITVTLTLDIVDIVERLAKKEHRKRAEMLRILIEDTVCKSKIN